MNRSVFYSILVGCIYIITFVYQFDKVHAMEKLDTKYLLIEGPWIQYVPDGEYGSAIELYDFLPDQSYRIVVSIIPENQSDTLPAAYKLLGSYTVQGNSLILRPKYNGEEIKRTIKVENNLLVILNEENGQILTLQRVRDQL